MFDPKHWIHAENITVGEFCNYLMANVPTDAILCFCSLANVPTGKILWVRGDSQVYMHLEADGSTFSVDYSSLSDLDEYADYEVRELEEIQSEY